MMRFSFVGGWGEARRKKRRVGLEKKLLSLIVVILWARDKGCAVLLSSSPTSSKREQWFFDLWHIARWGVMESAAAAKDQVGVATWVSG